jgi:hypothetical protein
LQLVFFGHVNNAAFVFLSHWLLQISAAVASILLFFLIYWVLPNRKLPVRAVLPTAIVIGLSWELAKMLYIAVLPWLDLHSVYGPFSVSVCLMLWAFITGLLLLAGAHYSARPPGGPRTGQRRKSRLVARTEKGTAGPSTALRSGRDDTSVQVPTSQSQTDASGINSQSPTEGSSRPERSEVEGPAVPFSH